MSNIPTEFSEVSPIRAGLYCKCPRCGIGKLYGGFLTFSDKCNHCDLDFSNFENADGPAVFITLFLGLIIVGVALVLEVKYQLPIWLHLLMWFPSAIGGSLLLLRPAKALMVVAQYHNNARQGELDQ